MKQSFLLLALVLTAISIVSAQTKSDDPQQILERASAKLRSSNGINVTFSLTQKDKYGHAQGSAKGIIKIKDLADTLYISQDAFEKRFRRVVGTSPKQFSSILRMRSITNIRQQKHTLTKIAFDAGYFDQPHFNKDFRLFTGQTPTDFFKLPSILQINDFLQ